MHLKPLLRISSAFPGSTRSVDHPPVLVLSNIWFRPKADVPIPSYISLLRQLERIVQFDAEVPNCAFNLGVA